MPNQIDLCSLVRCFGLSCCRKDTLTSRMKLSVKLSKFMANIKHSSNNCGGRVTLGKTDGKSVRLKSRQRSFFFCHTGLSRVWGFACLLLMMKNWKKWKSTSRRKRNLPTDARLTLLAVSPFLPLSPLSAPGSLWTTPALMILKGNFHNDNNFVHDLWMNKFYGQVQSCFLRTLCKR